MNTSDITKRRRNQMIFEGFLQGQLQHTLDDIQNRQLGGMPIVVNGTIVSNPQPQPQPQPPTPPFTPSAIQILVLGALDALLVANAAANIGPTRCARSNYLFFFTMAAAYNPTSSSPIVTGVKDGWNWDAAFSVPDPLAWFNNVLAHVMPFFIPSFNISIYTVTSIPAFTQWSAAWDTWWTARSNDGSVAAAVFPTAAQLPNGSTFLEVTTTQDISSYTRPDQWTPLSINGAQRRYLTYGWGDVRSTGLSAGQETTIKTQASTAFSSPSQRTAEVAALVTMVTSLSDEEKLIAEFWAGGPNTVTPPGMCIWMWRQYVTNVAEKTDGPFFASGLDLAINLFECSRLTWALKKQYMEARPIQEIRRDYANTPLTLYDGTTALGASWMPFQMPNFVTPPFPDFPSGHSTFSRAFANVMSTWFGSGIQTKSVSLDGLKLMSPVLPAQDTQPFGTFTIAQGASEIQAGIVPATPVTLSWNTWQAMADSAGVSRQYGGIHCVSAHVGGQLVADGVWNGVREVWWN